ncbi:MAG: hypothetical protein WCY29_11520 [Novosphingobium sp.]
MRKFTVPDRLGLAVPAERSRWKPWQRCGTVKFADVGDHRMTAKLARYLSDDELHWFKAVRTNDAPAHAMIDAEIRRREAWPPRLALIISSLALGVSLAGVIVNALQ